MANAYGLGCKTGKLILTACKKAEQKKKEESKKSTSSKK